MSNIADLRRFTDALDAPGFSEWDDQTMQELFGKRVWKAAQELLIAQSELTRTDESFGADAQRALVHLRPKLKAFREACIDQWKDDQ